MPEAWLAQKCLVSTDTSRLAKVFVLWRSFPGWLSISHLECLHPSVVQCSGMAFPQKTMSFWSTQLTEVVFESLWPGRSRYASLCKLAVAWQMANPLYRKCFNYVKSQELCKELRGHFFPSSSHSFLGQVRLLTWSPIRCFSFQPSTSWRRRCEHARKCLYLYSLYLWIALVGRRRWLPWSCTQIPSSFDEARISVSPGPRT